MARTIRVDDEVYAWLQTHARPFEDNPNSVLRRIAGIDPTDSKKASASARSIRSEFRHQTQVADDGGGSAMLPGKFDEYDRERTIKAVEQHYRTKLSKIGRRRKSLVDSSGSPYWVLGGYKDWHGVQPDMIQNTNKKNADGKLIIAKKTKTKIKIYSGDLRKFLENIDNCPITEVDDRHFNLKWIGGQPTIKEVPDAHLEFIAEIEYSENQKGKDKLVKNAGEYIKSLSLKQRQELLDQLLREQE